MAGYIIYSLDRDKFQSFVNNPTRQQLLAFAEIIADHLDDNDGEFEEADPVQDLPREPEELCDLVKERLARPDWYGDLSDTGKDLWCEAVWGFCCHSRPKDVGFRADHDGVYWDVIELSLKQLKVPPDQFSPDVALSAFGKRPYRYHPPAIPEKSGKEPRQQPPTPRSGLGLMLGLVRSLLKGADDEDASDGDDFLDAWHPMHSMHTPDEVRKMLEELKSVGPAFENVRNRQAVSDYDSLFPVLEKLVKEGRMLFIQVDT